VTLGVRDPAAAKDAPKGVSVRAIAEAAACDVVFLAVPSAAIDDAVRAMGELGGRIVVDCTNPVGKGLTLASPPEGSNAQKIAKLAPGARVLKGFSTFGAEFHADPKVGGTSVDVPIAGDDAEAKKIVSAIGERAGFRVLDAGPLASAHLLEAMALLWIHFAMRGGLGREVAWKLMAR
jgi:predicted dinucleotide-binding enzyme